ncbi:pLS20_p028 family conjugation system transmembrane protein [Streptococcus sobrinus]|uniref:pLS20_p028 family conjugation system transmembrane protein n=1 Tax=Streptococcus sobrinus TaxID=1310 RepID=UPI0003024A04|nr:hypothetical protein [Streptococcus sobrinus]
MDFQKFSDLTKAVSKTNGDFTGDDAQKWSQFYHYWSQYLHPTGAFWAFIYMLPGGIAKAMYQIVAALEHVYNNLFKLFGFFGYLGDRTTIAGQIYHYAQYFGLTIFTLALVYKGLTSAVGKRAKYAEIVTAFLMVTFVTSVLPITATTVLGAIAQDAQTAEAMTSKGKKFESLALQPMKSSVVDLKALVNNDWDTSKFELDDQGNLKPNQKSGVSLNYITDNTKKRASSNFVTNLDFTANYGATDTVTLDDMDKENNGAYQGVKGLFLHRLDANGSGITTINEHRMMKGLNTLDSVYMRYQVNWIGLFLQYGLLIALLFMMSLKLVKSFIDIFIQGIFSPLQGLMTAASGPKKYKELLMTIFSAAAGIILEVLIMRIVLEICRDFPSITLAATKGLEGSFFSGLNMWEQVLASALVYLGTFLAAMQGSSMIERWLGVSTGHGDTMQQMVGAMMMAGAAGNAMSAAGHAGLGLASAGYSTAKTGLGMAGRGTKAGLSAMNKGVGAGRGLYDYAKEHGIGNTVSGGLTNAGSKIQQGVENGVNKVGGLMDKIGEESMEAYNNAQNAVSPADPIDQAVNSSSSNNSGDSGSGGITDPITRKQNTEANRSGLKHDPTKSFAKNQASQAKQSSSQAKNALQQGSQQLSSGQNHIKGYQIDED